MGSSKHILKLWESLNSKRIIFTLLEVDYYVLTLFKSNKMKTSYVIEWVWFLSKQGFKKIASKRWEFQHDKFQRGCRDMLAEITRKKCEPSIFPPFLKASKDNTAASADQKSNCLSLMEENESLRRQNLDLQMQISQLKALEMKLMDCLNVSIHGHHHPHNKLRRLF